MSTRLYTAFTALAVGLAPLRDAAAAADENSTLHPASPLAGGALTEMAMGLIAVVALIFALSWFFRRFGKQAFAGKGIVSVVGGVSLGPRERAVLLQVGGTRLLVGVAPGQVSTLHVFDRESVGSGSEEQFSGRLEREMGGVH